MQPAIDAYLHAHAAQLGIGGVLDARYQPQVFCDANIIEIRPDGPQWRVGMMLNCGEYARHQGRLLEASLGYFMAVGQLTGRGHGGRYQVRSAQLGPDGYSPAWVHENFSSRAARWLLSTSPPTAPDPVSQARQAFGFPAGTVAVQWDV